MSDLKTQPTEQNVEVFLNTVEPEEKRQDCVELVEIMKRITGEEPVMWGESIVGFGTYHYTYASGREGDWPLTGFSPRKQSLTIYVTSGFDQWKDILKDLGKYKASVSCLYIKRLSDIDTKKLEQLITKSVDYMKETNA